MKVICVTLQDFTNGQAIGEIAGLMDIGDELTVKGECVGYGRNDIEVACYEFVEFCHMDAVFDQRNFATLPDNTADEMAEETREAIVNLETA